MQELSKPSLQIDRRVALQGLGVSVTLPWLESLSAAPPKPSQKKQPPTRLVSAFFPLGVNTEKWGASGEGKALKFKATLKPLESIKHKVTVLEGLTHLHLKKIHFFHNP